MSLAAFISTHFEPIIKEWELFARSLVPENSTLSVEQARDHAALLLQTIVQDLDASQSGQQRAEKSKGHGSQPSVDRNSAAQLHANARYEAGFDLISVGAEFRALRASVLRLWSEAHKPPSSIDVEQVTRFNEAIDQALAESLARFSERIEKDRNLFLAVLGHDLRTPLSAIAMAAHALQITDDVKRHRTAAARILRSSNRVQHMVNDLLDFTRMRLRGDFPIKPARMDLGVVAKKVIEEIQASHGDCRIDCTIEGDVEGYWDEARIAQLLSNLISNAVQHGARNTPIGFSAYGDAEGVRILIHNQGPMIPADRIPHIFDPWERAGSAKEGEYSPSAHLGLGLYIVRQIVAAHEGRIDVASSERDGTTFRVWLPRRRTHQLSMKESRRGFDRYAR